jgi:elongation factor 1-gamma
MHNLILERQVRALTTMNDHLSKRTFFVGERVTLADISVAAFIQKAVGVTYDGALRAKLPHLIRHLKTLANQPVLKNVYGDINYIDKALQYRPLSPGK